MPIRIERIYLFYQWRSDMSESTGIEGAKAYENLLVPALFVQWAPRLVAAAGIHRNDRVLDVACGTGVLAREAARKTGSPKTITGLDANANMLAVASKIMPEIHWQQGMAEELPFPDESFDAVIS